MKLTHALTLRPDGWKNSKHCPFCKTGQLEAARVSLTTRWGDTACEVTGVPADVCMDCGQYTIPPPVILRVQDLLVEDIRTTPTRRMAKLAYRRRRMRVDLPGILQGPEGVHSDMRVSNLSPDGAMIEHAVSLSPGDTCFLYLQLAGADLCARARVIWSRLHDSSESPGEAGARLFRSGLRFPDLSKEAKDQIAQYLATLSARNRREQ